MQAQQIPQITWAPDVTVATIVASGDRFLLVEEVIVGNTVLNQPAGHLEPGESLHAAALRETLEETGWSVELSDLVGVYQWSTLDGSKQFLRFTFAATAVAHDPQRQLDDGILRAVWLTREEIVAQGERLRSPMVLANIDDWLSGKRYPLTAIRCLFDGAGTDL
jgi:8-oxo-dGTP pyrophosphatase MutT (NUDIX family)